MAGEARVKTVRHASADLEDHLTCSLCLEVFNTPKMLPCHHTFCEACVQTLVSKAGKSRSIQCPQCRKKMRVSQKTVSSLPVNFYLTPLLEDLRDPDHCLDHTREKLHFFCVACNEAVCCQCVLLEHNGHTLKDLKMVREEMKENLEQCQIKFDSTVTRLTRKVEAIQSRLKIANIERLSVEFLIMVRARELSHKIEGQMNKTLSRMKTVMGPMGKAEQELSNKVTRMQELQGRMKEALSKKMSSQDLAKFTREIGEELNSQLVTNLEQIEESAGKHHFGVPSIDRSLQRGIVDVPRAVFMSPTKHANNAPNITYRHLFRHCHTESPDIMHVHAMCVVKNEIWVALGSPRSNKAGIVARFSKRGHMVNTPTAIKGRVCIVDIMNGWVRVEGRRFKPKDIRNCCEPSLSQDVGQLYDVYRKHLGKSFLRVTSHKCELRSVRIWFRGAKILEELVSEILTTNPVAMDLSQDGQVLAVVEERIKHHVLTLFNKHNFLTPFTLFWGDERFDPLDVSFCVFNERELLVVADGAKKRLVFIDVDPTAGCNIVSVLTIVDPSPEKIELKPTALYSFDKGKLLVGCEGGYIFYVTQVTNISLLATGVFLL